MGATGGKGGGGIEVVMVVRVLSRESGSGQVLRVAGRLAQNKTYSFLSFNI